MEKKCTLNKREISPVSSATCGGGLPVESASVFLSSPVYRRPQDVPTHRTPGPGSRRLRLVGQATLATLATLAILTPVAPVAPSYWPPWYFLSR